MDTISENFNGIRESFSQNDKSDEVDGSSAAVTVKVVASVLVAMVILVILIYVISSSLSPSENNLLKEAFDDPSGQTGIDELPPQTADSSPESLYYRARILNDRQNRPEEALEAAYSAALRIPTTTSAGNRSRNNDALEEKLADTVVNIIEANPDIQRRVPAPPVVNRATAIIAGNVERDPRMQRVLLESFNDKLTETQNRQTTATSNNNITSHDRGRSHQSTTKKYKRAVKRPNWRIDKHNVHDSSINAAAAAKIAENARLAGAASAGEIAVVRQIKEFRAFLSDYAKNGSQTGPTPSNVKEKASDEGIQLVFWRIETGSHKLPDGTKISEQQILADAWAAASASENPVPRREALANAVIDCIISKKSTVCHSGRIARITGASDGFTDAPKMITKAMARNLIYAKCGKLTMAASDLHEKAQTDEQKEQIQQKLYGDISAVIDEFADKAPPTVISNLRVECEAAAEL